MNFIAIDFETANDLKTSACAVGLVKVQDGVIVDELYTLINPLSEFSYKNVRVHKIQPYMVDDAPTFKECWGELQAFIGDNVLFAHNANFDMAVLQACLQFAEEYDICIGFQCTYRLARKVWPAQKSYRLSALAEHLHIPLNHHHALDDARAAAQIVLNAAEQMGATSLEQLLAKLNIKMRQMIS